MTDFIPVNTPLLDGNEKKYLNECIDTGWISSEGPFVKCFEDEFARKVACKYGIAVCNGSAALDAALASLELRKGDEVIMPSFTIISCATAILRAGAKPVLIDSDPNTWNMDVAQIESKISKKTKAIMVVHIYGLPVDMDPILVLAKKYKLKVIEDAAEAHGQTYKGKPCGSFGDIAIFSFYPNKLITTGEGGMIVTNNQKLAEKCSSLRNLCFIPEKRFVHENLGWNFRMTNLQAALGVAQLEQWDKAIAKKRHIGQFYQKLLKNLETAQLPLEKTSYAQNIYWVFGLVLKPKLKFDAQETMQKLQAEGIGTRPFFYPMHQQPIFKKMGLFKNERYPVAENLYQQGFYIPSGLGITDQEMETVAQKVIKVLS
ncbi:DegT/DnrJ/EryC1/StrS family aminotransferase [Candidatus Beckwithbacteria bacterium]|nr:DegT/DnrJ/EryC1/StrS family aminotransferase [Candidatus Beckwithbacteria bacterium]